MQSDNQSSPRAAKIIRAGRAISAVPVLIIFMAGIVKLLKPPGVVKTFAEFGFPEYQIAILAVVQIICAIIYIIPQTSVLGAILLTGYLGGAVATHVRMGQWLFIGPAILGAIVWLGLLLREPRLRRLLPLRRFN